MHEQTISYIIMNIIARIKTVTEINSSQCIDDMRLVDVISAWSTRSILFLLSLYLLAASFPTFCSIFLIFYYYCFCYFGRFLNIIISTVSARLCSPVLPAPTTTSATPDQPILSNGDNREPREETLLSSHSAEERWNG